MEAGASAPVSQWPLGPSSLVLLSRGPSEAADLEQARSQKLLAKTTLNRCPKTHQVFRDQQNGRFWQEPRETPEPHTLGA